MYKVDIYDGLQTSVLSADQSNLSDSSSLNSSFLNNRISSRNQLYIHADSLESLDDMTLADDESAEIMAFKNTSALCDDLRYISGMPEVCDVKFLVGRDRTPVYGVKAILATRSRVFYEMVISAQKQQNLLRDFKPQKKTRKFLPKLFKWKIGKSKAVQKEPKPVDDSNQLQINIHDFTVDTFKRVLLYLHCGSTSVTLHSVIGVMNAADAYGVEDLRGACYEFALRFINVRTVLRLLLITDAHTSYRWTKTIIAKIYKFIDENAREVLSSQDFETLQQETAILILGRPDTTATEEDKWGAAVRWSKNYTGKEGMFVFQNTIAAFIHKINFIEIPLGKLMREIRPLCVVPDDVMNRAIVQQASTRFVIGQERRPVSRRNTITSSSAKRPVRRSVDSLTWARNYVQRRASFNSTSSDSRSPSYDSGFVSSSDEGYMV